MPGIAIGQRRTRLPPPNGAQVDWTHPLSQRMTSCWTFQAPFDLVSRTPIELKAARVLAQGLVRDDNTAAAGSYVTQGVDNWITNDAASISFVWKLLANPSGVFGYPGAWPNNTAPFCWFNGYYAGGALKMAVARSSSTLSDVGLVNVSAGTTYTITMTFAKGDGARGYVDGRQVATIADNGSGLYKPSTFAFQVIADGAVNLSTTGIVSSLVTHSRALTAADAATYHADPYCMLRW